MSETYRDCEVDPEVSDKDLYFALLQHCRTSFEQLKVEENRKYTPDELLVRKWKRTGLMDGVPPERELAYARVLEMEAKNLIDNYRGKRLAPNIWPDVRRKFDAGEYDKS